MRYFEFTAETPYTGTDDISYHAFPDGVTKDELNAYADDLAQDNAESFDYLVFGWDYDPVLEGDMSKEEYEDQMADYYHDSICTYREITEEEYLLGIKG